MLRSERIAIVGAGIGGLTAALDLEFRIMRPDGEERHIRARGELLVAGPGGPEHLAVTMQDMTEKRRADAHLRGS